MMQHRGNEFVDTRRADGARRGHTIGSAEHERTQLDRVDAEIERGPAAECAVEEPVVGRDRHAESEVGLHDERLAEASFGEQVAQRDVRREEPRPHRFHEEQSALAGARQPSRVPAAPTARAASRTARACPRRARRSCRRRAASAGSRRRQRRLQDRRATRAYRHTRTESRTARQTPARDQATVTRPP